MPPANGERAPSAPAEREARCRRRRTLAALASRPCAVVSPPALVAVIVLGAAAQASGAANRFHGTSSRGHAIVFAFDGQAVRGLRVRMDTFCALTGEESATVRVSSAGLGKGRRFSVRVRSRDGTSFTVRGTVGSRRAKGTIASGGRFDGNTCRGAATWTARG